MGEKPRTIVLLSGGLNSAVMLYDMVTFKKAEVVECMIFDSDFGIDFKLARDLSEKCGIPYSMWSYDGMPVVDVTPTDLYLSRPELNRAALITTMFNHAIHRATLLGAESVTIGISGDGAELPASHHLEEYFIYAGKMFGAFSMGLSMPLLDLTKAEVFKLALDLNKMVEVTRDTNSCDVSKGDIQHPWGYGCGSCPGCVRRWKAWDEYLQMIGQGP